MSFFTAAILLCAVRDAQCRTSECSRARKKSRAVFPGQVDSLAGRGNCPYGSKKWPRARKCESCLPIGQAWIYPWDKPAGIFKWAGLAKTTRGYVAWYLEFEVADSSVVSWVNPCKGGFWACLAVGIIWKVSTYLHWQWYINHVNHVYI